MPAASHPRHSRARRAATTLATLASIGITATSALAYSALDTFTGSVTHIDGGRVVSAAAPTGDGPINILLVGNDDRTGLSEEQRRELHVGQKDYGAHTEPIILVHIPKETNPITLVSLPRDSLVTIPEHANADGTIERAHQGKINAAYGEGGPKLVIETVERATGVPINHYVEVGLGGFVNLINDVGGVPVCLAQPLKDKDAGLDLPAGAQTLDGRDSLALVRARHIDNDLGRIGRQQQFLLSLGKQTLSSGALINPLRMDDLMKVIATSIKTDESLGVEQLQALASRLRHVDPDAVKLLTVPVAEANLLVPGAGSTVMWDRTKADPLFSQLSAGQGAPKGVVTTAPSAPPSDPPPLEKIAVRIVNAGGVAGLGTRVKAELRSWGFRTAGVTVAEDTQSETEILYPSELAQEASTVAAAIPGAVLRLDATTPWAVTVRAGSAFKGTGSISQPKAAAGAESSAAPAESATSDEANVEAAVDPKVSAAAPGACE